jgi:ATP-dependent Lon protease
MPPDKRVSEMESKIKIIVLDDEPIVGERLKASLERAGFVVDAYSSSREALTRLQSERYDILVTDLKMSGPDGMDVLREAQRLNPDVKSVVITGFATTETAEEALRSGAVVFVPKPFKMKQLKDLLIELSRKETEADG